MPLTAKGSKIMSAMTKEYGAKKGKSVFYASINKGKITGAEGTSRKSKKKKARRKTKVAGMKGM